MRVLIIIGVVVAALAVPALSRFKPGYRGAIGFKNRHASEIATLSLTGFQIVECRTLARGEHSSTTWAHGHPGQVTITWRLVTDTTDRTARVSLAGVPKGRRTVSCSLCCQMTGTWTVEYSPKLQLEKLQRGE